MNPPREHRATTLTIVATASLAMAGLEPAHAEPVRNESAQGGTAGQPSPRTAVTGSDGALDEQALRAELQALRSRITRLERLLDERGAGGNAALRSEPVASRQPQTGESLTASPGNVAPVGTQPGDLTPSTGHEPPPEHIAKSAAAPTSSTTAIDIGGAVRLAYGWQDYSERSKERGGDLDFDLFALDIDVEHGRLSLSAQYRWYQGFEAVHHAWLGYRFDDRWQLQLGISQVPFGLLPYASHSFWFGAGYYMGFEDDYDNGIKLVYDGAPWQAQLAFYKNAEYANGSRHGRYSFDVVTGGQQQNEEINQANGRVAYRWAHGAENYSEPGVSVQWSQLYNELTGETGTHSALAIHWDGHYGPWNLQAQWLDYRYDPANPPGVSDATIQIAAFDAPFLMAADGQMLVLNAAREIDTGWSLPDSVTCYNDYSQIFPAGSGQRDSIQNVTGCLVVMGGFYTYIDWITGKNMWFIGGPGIGLNDDQWRSRFNINVGYYF